MNRDGILEFPCDVERLPNGNTLIADAGDEAGGGSEILEVSPQGEIVWRYGDGLAFAHCARRLPNGCTLIADTTNDRVIEVEHDGRVCFTSDHWGGAGQLSDGSHLAYPNHVHALPHGRLLITDRNNNRVLIADRAGRVVRVWGEGVRHPHNADLLPNGHLLVADSDGGAVIEFDADGRVAWRFDDVPPDGLLWPRDADRLPNGNTLITDSKHSRVIEVTPTGRIVWQYAVDYFANFYEADRLPNGNTLIAGQQHQEVFEVDAAGAVVWRFRNYTRPFPVHPRLVNGTFRDLGADGAPASWVLATRFAEGGGHLIRGRGPGGEPAPGLEYDRGGALTLQQTVAVTAGRRYHITARLRADLNGGTACVQFAFLDAMNGFLCDVTEAPRGRTFTGAADWLEDAFAAVAPPGAVAADVRLFITGCGRVWTSEISVKEE